MCSGSATAVRSACSWPPGIRARSASLLASITAPTLVVAADRDVVRTEHALLLASRLPNARLLIVPGNHGDYLGELMAAAGDPGPLRRTLPFLVSFLDQPEITTQS